MEKAEETTASSSAERSGRSYAGEERERDGVNGAAALQIVGEERRGFVLRMPFASVAAAIRACCEADGADVDIEWAVLLDSVTGLLNEPTQRKEIKKRW